MIGKTSSGITHTLRDRDIYSICRCCWNVDTHKWKVHNPKIEIRYAPIQKVGMRNNRKHLLEHKHQMILTGL
jgi:hypothetical protein